MLGRTNRREEKLGVEIEIVNVPVEKIFVKSAAYVRDLEIFQH